MVLPWWRRSGGAGTPPPANSETTSISPCPPAAARIHRISLFQRRLFPPAAQSEPVDQHQQTEILGARGSCQMPPSENTSTTDGNARGDGRKPVVSRLLHPVHFRRRQPSSLQREGGSSEPQSKSVPAAFLSPTVENLVGGARLPSPRRHRGSSTSVRGSLPSNDCTEVAFSDLIGTKHSKNVGSLSAVTAAPATGAARGAQKSVLGGFHTAAATAPAGARRSFDPSDVSGSEGPGETIKSKDKCQESRQQHTQVTQRSLKVAASGRREGAARTDVSCPRERRGVCGNSVQEDRFEECQAGLERASNSSLKSSIASRQQRGSFGQSAVVAKTRLGSAATAVACGGPSASCGPRSSTQEEAVCAPRRSSMQQVAVKKPCCTLQLPATGGSSKLATNSASSSSPRQTTAAQNSLSHPDKSIAHQTGTGKTPSKESKASCGVRSTDSKKDTPVKGGQNVQSTTTPLGESPQVTAGVQGHVSSSVFTKSQGRQAAGSEECRSPACAAVAQRKAPDALQPNRQATAKPENVPPFTHSRLVPFPFKGDKLRTVWSVEGLSDSLIVKRGLATVLLVDGIGSPALLRYARSTPDEWQQLLQQTSLTDSADYEDAKLLTELNSKIRSRHVLLELLQGVVSLQQVLPVDVTSMQADLRLLSLQQLVVLRLRNSFDHQLDSSYYSCHASFSQALDRRIAELLGAILVNEAFFELFAPLVAEQMRQQKLGGRSACSTEENGLLCVGGARQSTVQESNPLICDGLLKVSSSRASTRSSSPQNVRVRGRVVAEAAAKRSSEAEEQHQQHRRCGSGGGIEQTESGELSGSVAGAAVSPDADPEKGGEGRTLRGAVSGREAVATHKSGDNDGKTRPSIAFRGTGGEAQSGAVRNSGGTTFLKAPEAAGDGQAAENKGEKELERLEHKQEEVQRGTQKQTQEFRRSSCEKKVDTMRRQEYTGTLNAENPRAVLVGGQAHFLVKSCAEKNLLTTYSASTFDIPAGEKAADRSQLRALGAGLVRQLGLIVSAAGRTEGNSSSGTDNSNSVSAADLDVLQRVQKYILQENSERLQSEGAMGPEGTTNNNVTLNADTRPTNMLHPPVKGKAPKTIDSVAAAAVTASRPAGVWVRLLVPCKAAAAKVERGGLVHTAVARSPVLGVPPAAAAPTHPGEEKTTGINEKRSEEQQGSRRMSGHGGDVAAVAGEEGKRGSNTEALDAAAGGAHCGLHENASIRAVAAAAAKAGLLAEIAATRRRKAAAPVEEKQVETRSSVKEKPFQDEGWMEAFLWLRLPPTVGCNTARATARHSGGQEASVLLQQPREDRAAAAAASKCVRGRGMLELVVSNDRPVGEVLLWGVPPENSQLLWRGTDACSPVASNGASSRAKWAVVAIPDTVVLQQHLGSDNKVTSVVSELKERLSKRSAMQPAAEYNGGAATAAAFSKVPAAAGD